MEQNKVELTPEFLARYEVGEVLGAGAMGMVVSAVQRSVGRKVAIKFLKVSNPTMLARFLREGRVMARISHPNVTKVFDFGDLNGHPYLVTELLPGGSLGERLRKGPIEWRTALQLGVACLEGLAACHAGGIIHRDIKPDNILFETPLVPKISDLGLAADDADVEAITRTGAVLGTPIYMAPEQLQKGEMGVKSDLWAMAAVIYEMIAGRPPITADSIPALVAAHGAPVPPLESFAPDVPEEVRLPLMRALSADAAGRQESVAELGAELAFATGLTFNMPAAPRLTDKSAVLTKTPTGKSPAISRPSGPVSAPRRTGSARSVSSVVPVPQPPPFPTERFVAIGVGVCALLGLIAGVAMFRGRHASAPPSLASAAPASASPSAEPSLWMPCEDTIYTRVEPGVHAAITQAAFSADRQLAATLASDGTVTVWDVAAKGPRAAVRFNSANPSCAAFTRDGSRLACATKDSIFLWSWKEGGGVSRLDAAVGADALHFLRGDELAIVGARGVRSVRLTGREPPRALGLDYEERRSSAASPDGSQLAIGLASGMVLLRDGAGNVTKINAHGLRKVQSLVESFETPTAGSVLAIAFAPDGTRLVTAGSEGHARIWKTRTGDLIDAYTSNGAPIWCVTMRADGQEISLGPGRMERGRIAYWELASLNPGTLDLGGTTVLNLAYIGNTADLVVVTDSGFRVIPKSARTSDLKKGGYDSMFGFDAPNRPKTEPAPSR